MPRWKPNEVMIHDRVECDRRARSLQKKLKRVPILPVPNGSPATINGTSTILDVNNDPLPVSINKGKGVLYVGPAGKAVDRFTIDDKRMVCPEFARLKWANNCYFQCDWCYLKGTFRANRPYLTAHVEYGVIEQQLEREMQKSPGPLLFNAGELADSLSTDHLTKAAAHFIRWFAKQGKKNGKGYLFLLTKSDNVDHILHIADKRRTIIAWSMNAPDISLKFELGAPSFQERLEAARKVEKAGYRLRLRIDPIVPVEGWQDMYAKAIRKIFRTIKPERVTLGTLRFEERYWTIRKHLVSQALLPLMDRMRPMFRPKQFTNGKGKTITTSGKYSFTARQRVEIFKFAIEEIRKHSPETTIALCKESLAVWRAVQLKPSRCRCVCQLDYAHMAQGPNGMYKKCI